MNIYKKIFIIIFFLVLLIPTCFINLKENQISEIDNSKLPEISTIEDITTFQDYFEKRIGFRKEMINTYTYLNDILFKEMVHPTYTYGTEGYVFFKLGNENHDDEYLDIFANFVKDMQNYVTQKGKYFLFIINPTKISVYSQYLPKGYNYTNYRINYLKKRLDELGVNYIDNTECLKKVSESEQVFNVKYDAGHWNETGTFYGMNNVYDKMQSDGVDISRLEVDDYVVLNQLKESLPVSEFKIHEEVPLYDIKKPHYTINSKYSESIEISKAHDYYIETSKDNEDNNLLFFRGSYMNSKEKFVAEKFANSYFIHNYDNSINFDYYFNITNPDIVLFETVEYAINENYYSREQMELKKYNKNYHNFEKWEKSDELVKINTDEIIKQIEDNIKESIPLTKINLNEENFQYAYLGINEKIYDFCYEKGNATITMDTELLKKSSNIKIIVVSEELGVQQIISIK